MHGSKFGPDGMMHTSRAGAGYPSSSCPPMPRASPRMGNAQMHSQQRRRCMSDDVVAVEVVLNLYDYSSDALVQGINDWAPVTGTGAFHAAVEVYGLEWSYCSTSRGDGIYSCMPRENTGHVYRESIPLGVTFNKVAQVEILLGQMSKNWSGEDYNMIWKNCCHFSDDLCQRLGVGAIPAWVNPTLGHSDMGGA